MAFFLKIREEKKRNISLVLDIGSSIRESSMSKISVYILSLTTKKYHHQTSLKVFSLIIKKRRKEQRFFFSMNRTFVVIMQRFSSLLK